VSRVHRLMDPGIVSRPPWTGSHEGGTAHRRRARQCSMARELAAATQGERENGRAVKWNGGRILQSSARCSK
jgi:hypothetical protein